MNSNIKVLSTVAALGADCVINNGYAYINGLPAMRIKGMRPAAVIAPVTEQVQITTLTPTVVTSTLYAIGINYVNKKTGVWENKIYTLPSSGVGATATTICDYFRSAINNDSAIVPITATGTTTLILTAVVGNFSQQVQFFTLPNLGVGTFSSAATQAPIVGVGKGLYIKRGPFTSVDLVDASYYYQVEMNYANADAQGSSQMPTPLIERNNLLVLSTATNVESLVGTYGTVTQILAGVVATWSTTPAGTSPQLQYTTTTGALALTGTGNTWTTNNLRPGDILFLAASPTVYYPIGIETSDTAGISTDKGQASGGPAAYGFVTLRRTA